MSYVYCVCWKLIIHQKLKQSIIALISHTSKVMLTILQARLQQYVNWELPDVQAGFRKGRGTRSNCQHHWIIEKARESSGCSTNNSILILSTHVSIRVEGSFPQDCPSLQMPIGSQGCHQDFWQNCCTLEVPMIPSLDLVNLLEWLKRLRKPVCSLHCWFITNSIKRY